MSSNERQERDVGEADERHARPSREHESLENGSLAAELRTLADRLRDIEPETLNVDEIAVICDLLQGLCDYYGQDEDTPGRCSQ